MVSSSWAGNETDWVRKELGWGWGAEDCLLEKYFTRTYSSWPWE